MLTRTHASPAPRRLTAALAAALPLCLLGHVSASQAALVISQVYGGGGNSGATYKNDFVELLNNGSASVSVGGWSVQYASATGGTWQVTQLPAGLVVQPGQYVLVQMAAGTGGTTALVPDVLGTTAMSGTSGKVALVTSTAALSGSTPVGLLDMVSYGSATPIEGTPTPVLSNTTAALRTDAGCTDTNNNAADFVVGSPSPRNSASPLVSCGSTSAPPPVTPVAPSLEIPAIQGMGATSAYVGQVVRTSGVVTRLTNNGFYLQALQGDGLEASSDGLYVFTNTAPGVSVGQLIALTGTVAEFAGGGSTVTQLTSPADIVVQGSGYSVTPTPITLPVSGGLERYEGMVVTVNGPLTVNQNYFQARYGQLTLSAGGRLETPTNRHRPGTQAAALAADNASRRIVLEDGNSRQNVNPTPFTGPTGALRGGDTLGSVTGIIDYGPSTATVSGPGDYRIVPLNPGAISYTITHPRPTYVPSVGGNYKVASFNVLNYFTTFTNGETIVNGQTGQTCVAGQTAAASCRGASNYTEFLRQRTKIVEALSKIDADAVGLMEVQNNTVAAQNLADALNGKMGAGTYAVAPGPAAGVIGTDAIKVSMIYKPAKLQPVGLSQIDAAPINNRPTLAQTFRVANGEAFTLVVNHLKSKGSCPTSGLDKDQGDGQGCHNDTRLQQVKQLRNFVGSLQAASGASDVLLVGDFNAYAKEDPIHALTSNGYVDQIGRFNTFGYSYVFDGAAGRLDHAISSASLSHKVSHALDWHINADESLAQDYNLEFKQPLCTTCAPDPYTSTPYRSSDHDPLVVGLNLYNQYITASATSTSVVGTTGDDLITVGAGRRTLTGGAGRDQFAFRSDFTGGATITDFAPRADVISLRAVLQALRVQVADPIGQGYVSCGASGATDALVYIDPDANGPSPRRPLISLKNIACDALSHTNYIF